MAGNQPWTLGTRNQYQLQGKSLADTLRERFGGMGVGPTSAELNSGGVPPSAGGAEQSVVAGDGTVPMAFGMPITEFNALTPEQRAGIRQSAMLNPGIADIGARSRMPASPTLDAGGGEGGDAPGGGTGTAGSSPSSSAGETAAGMSGIEGPNQSTIGSIANALSSNTGKMATNAAIMGTNALTGFSFPGLGALIGLAANITSDAAGKMAAMNADPNLSGLSQAQMAALQGLYGGNQRGLAGVRAQNQQMQINAPDTDANAATGPAGPTGPGSSSSGNPGEVDNSPNGPNTTNAGTDATGPGPTGEGPTGPGSSSSGTPGGADNSGDSGGASAGDGGDGGGGAAGAGGDGASGAGAYKRGGIIPNKHKGKGDDEKVRAQGGEAVMTKPAVQKFAPQLSAMNVMGGGRPIRPPMPMPQQMPMRPRGGGMGVR